MKKEAREPIIDLNRIIDKKHYLNVTNEKMLRIKGLTLTEN